MELKLSGQHYSADYRAGWPQVHKCGCGKQATVIVVVRGHQRNKKPRRHFIFRCDEHSQHSEIQAKLKNA